MFRWVLNIFHNIRLWYLLKKKLRQARREDPYIYK
jgi:hypothetical protein